MITLSLAGISLRDFEYVLAVARTGHFGRAAQQCAVSQPALSEQIRKLEALLGCVLFERGRRGSRPTEAGRAILPQLERAVQESRAVLMLARGRNGAFQGTLSLGVIPTLGPYYIPGLISVLRDDLPAVTLQLHEAQTELLISGLADFTLDVALMAMPVERPGLASAPLFFEPFRLLMPVDHPLASRRVIMPADLVGQELLLLEAGHCLRDQTISLCRAPVPGVNARVASSLEMLRYMVAAGEGVAVVPALAIAQQNAAAPLVTSRGFGDPHAGRTIGLVWRGMDPRGASFERLVALLRSTRPAGTLLPDEGGLWKG